MVPSQSPSVPFGDRTLQIQSLFDAIGNNGERKRLFKHRLLDESIDEEWCLTAEYASRDAKLFIRRCSQELEYKQKWSQIDSPTIEDGIDFGGKIRLGPGSYRPIHPPAGNSTIFRSWPANSDAMCLTYGGRNVFLQGCQNAHTWIQLTMNSVRISTLKTNGNEFDLGYDPLRKFSKLRLFFNERFTNPSIEQWRLYSTDVIDVDTIAFPPRFTNNPTQSPV